MIVKFPENGGQWLLGIVVVAVWGSAKILRTAIAVRNASDSVIVKFDMLRAQV